MFKKLPQIDETRVYHLVRAHRTKGRPMGTGLTFGHHYEPQDITPEEIEARFQRRLAEIRYARLVGNSSLTL